MNVLKSFLNPKAVSTFLVGALLGTMVIGVLLPNGGSMTASAEYQRPYPMPHQYWAKNDEFYVFASGGQQGGLYVYGVPSMKYLSEIPMFNEDMAWGWTSEDSKIRDMLTNPWTGELVTRGDTHHPSASKTDGKYDGRWIFINDKPNGRIGRVDLDTFRTGQVLWIPNTTGGIHGFNVGPDSKLAVTNLEHEQYPDENIRKHLGLELDPIKGPYAAGISGIKIADDGTMSNAWQVWSPWQFDMARIGWGESKGWIITTAYNTERATDPVGMFKRDQDYLFFWNIASIEKAVAEKKYITSKQSPDVPVLSWKDVEVYMTPIPLNPHGVDVSPDGRFSLVSGKATTLTVAVDFEEVLENIKEKKFVGEEFGIKKLDPEEVRAASMDLGMGATHIEFDEKGYAYVGFFVDSDIKKVPLGGQYAKLHGQTPWKVTEVLPAHFSVGHLVVPGGDSAQPYGKYIISMNKLAKDTFLPHGPLESENHELYDISGNAAQLVDQMSLGPETHYSQALPVSLVAPKVKKSYPDAKAMSNEKPKVEYDYAAKEVRVTMSVVRSFFTPGAITVPQGWKVKAHLVSGETAMDMTHGFAIDGYDVSVSMDPGEVRDIEWIAHKEGVYWYYCNWFCSELHMEMRGRMIVIPEKDWTPDKETKLAQ